MNNKKEIKRIIYNYITTNKINGKQYVGMHSTDNIDDGYLGSGQLIMKAIKKYGKENFTREILCVSKTLEDAFENEAFFIIIFNTLVPMGYNISPCGGIKGIGSVSEETRQKKGKKIQNK